MHAPPPQGPGNQAPPTNPWIMVLSTLSGLALLTGLILTLTNADPLDDYNPQAAAVAQPLLIIGGVLLAGLLTAGAVNWQLRRR